MWKLSPRSTQNTLLHGERPAAALRELREPRMTQAYSNGISLKRFYLSGITHMFLRVVRLKLRVIGVGRFGSTRRNFERSVLGCIEADFLQRSMQFAACFQIYKVSAILHRSNLALEMHVWLKRWRTRLLRFWRESVEDSVQKSSTVIADGVTFFFFFAMGLFL